MTELVQLTEAQRALAEVETAGDAKELYDKLEALSQYARRYRVDHEKQNEIAEAKLRTARKGGAILADAQMFGRDENVSRDGTRLPEGLSRNQSSRWQALAAIPADAFEEHLAAVKASDAELTLAGALTLARVKERAAQRAASEVDGAARSSTGARWRVEHSGLDALDVEDGTVDVILTDPPYDLAAVHGYPQLVELAERALRDGGSMFVMLGQHHLIEALNTLADGTLTYQWTLAYLTPGGQSPRSPMVRSVNCFWKPVVWFVKGSYRGRFVGDVAHSATNANEKNLHDWGQSESGFADLVDRCSDPGDLILDPYCGSGTTGVAALAAGRRFLGCDHDAAAVARSRSRLSLTEAELAA